MAGRPYNTAVAGTLAVSNRAGVLETVVINKAVISGTITIYDNIPNGILAADPDGISVSQTPSGAGNLTITGALAATGVATLGYGKRVTITSVSNETTKNFTITGTNFAGDVITEVIAGGNNTTVTGTKQFLTVTQVAVSAATTGAITVGATAETGTKVATITTPATVLDSQYSLAYNMQLMNGCTVVVTGTQDVTVVFS